jgi:hypothetical protein
MRLNNIKMTMNFSRTELLEKLKANLANHAKIVEEARAGYIEKAKKAVADRLDELKAGKVVALSFHLSPPVDNSEVYKTTIGMLEMSKDENIVLTADEFRQLVQDEWDWTDNFLVANRAYSDLAAGGAARKGL